MARRPLGLDPKDPLVGNAVLGVEVTDWMEGPIGSFVMGRVRKRLELLEESLKTLDPYTKAGEIVRTQAEIMHWDGFAAWLGSAIQDGINAQQILGFEVGENDGEDPGGIEG